MIITNSDKLNCDNMIKLLKRAKIELVGAEEILGSAEVLKWMAGLASRMEKAIKEQEDAKNIMSAQPVKELMPMPKPKNKKKGG